jgi:hypothetical protein
VLSAGVIADDIAVIIVVVAALFDAPVAPV